MFAHARSVKSQLLWSICCVSAVSLMSGPPFTVAQEAKSPSAEEKKRSRCSPRRGR